MVYRIFVEKKEGLRHEADHLKEDIISFLQIKNLKDLRVRDVLKFVVGSEEDLEAAKYIINTYHPRSRIYLSPVFGEIEAKDIVKFVLDNNLSSVYTQVQLHKIIWDPDMKGV